MSEGTPLTNETELLAWAVLRAANRMQARSTTVRLVVPRAPEVVHDLHMEIAEERLLRAEEWLVDSGYLAPADVVLTLGTYTITPAGLEWLRGGMPEPLEAPQKVTEPAAGPRAPPQRRGELRGAQGVVVETVVRWITGKNLARVLGELTRRMRRAIRADWRDA